MDGFLQEETVFPSSVDVVRLPAAVRFGEEGVHADPVGGVS